MQLLPKYWARAQEGVLQAWGWSERSADDARAVAERRVATLVEAIRAGTAKGSYGWVPPREEVMHEDVAPDGAVLGVVTRNHYGCEVLNTDRFLIADVDVPPERGGGGLGRLFGRRGPGPGDPRAAALSRLREFADLHPELGVRIYETFGGWRVFVDGAGLGPDSPDAADLFRTLEADRTYVHLCRKFHTCRARLTPKPWRCGLRRPAPAWPPQDPAAERAWTAWLDDYTRASAGYATARLTQSSGPPADGPTQRLIDLHDQATRTTEPTLPLA